MTAQTRRVLFVIYNHSHYRELYSLAEAIAARPGADLYAVFEYDYAGRDDDLTQLWALNFTCYTATGDPLAGPGETPRSITIDPKPPQSANGGILNKLKNKVNEWFLSEDEVQDLKYANVETTTYETQADSTRQLFEAIQPHMVVFGEITLNYPTGFMWIQQARAHGAQSVVYPYALMGLPYNNEMQALYSRDASRHITNSVRERYANQNPSMVREYQGTRVLRMEFTRTVASIRAGIVPPLPWIPNSSDADVVAVESEGMRQMYDEAGFPAAQVHVVGQVHHDQLAEIIADRETYRQRLVSLDPGASPVFAVGLPPDQTGSSELGISLFPNYPALLQYFIDTFAAFSEAAFLVSPHPRLTPADYAPLANLPNVHIITDHNVHVVIALADAYIAVSSSSTIRTALACAIPTINFDLYRYNHEQYRGIPAVIEVDSQEVFETTLRNMIDDPAYAASLKEAAQMVSETWGKLDGKATARIMSLLGFNK